MPDATLYQFTASHFNEKARWALDWKGVPYARRSLLPGPHIRTIRSLTGGHEVPVLRDGDAVIPGSAQIIDHLEQTRVERPLYPEEPAERERALAIQKDFDEQVGPAVRLAFFFDNLDGQYAAAAFGSESSVTARLAYRAAFHSYIAS